MKSRKSLSKLSKAVQSAGDISRRDFARKVALATTTAALLPGELLSKMPPQAPGAESALSAASQAEVELKIETILKKYGDRLSEEQKKDIRRLVTEGQKALEKLRTFPLENSDQPATVLKLYPDPVSASPRR